MIHLSPNVFAVVSPADRQKVTRWLREALKSSDPAIQSSVEQRQISADSPDGYYGYTDRYGYGGYGYYYDNSADKRAVRYENRAEGINAARSLINGIKNGTVEIRRKMTEKYQVEF